MISHISGILDHIDKNSVTVDVQGIGYKIYLPAPLLSEIGHPGDKIKIFTEQIVREDSITLYGFRSKEEKSLFNSLISVSGIGPKTAMSIISGIPMDRLVSAIASGQAEIISSVPGVGTKTAQRMIIELKEKIGKIYGVKPADLARGVPGEEATISDAISALITLGYSPREARDAIMKLSGDNKSVEDLIKSALKNLV